VSETDPRNEPVSPGGSGAAEASAEAALRPGGGETAAAEDVSEAAEAAPAGETIWMSEAAGIEAPEVSAAASEEPAAASEPAAEPEPGPAALEAGGPEAPDEAAQEEAAGEAVAVDAVAERPEEAAAPDEQAAPVNQPAVKQPAVKQPAVEPSAVEEEPAAPATNGESPAGAVGVPGMDWYIIHSYSGFENKVRESLRTRADAFGFGERIGEILIPTEDVVEMRNGKKVTSKRLIYPGYVLVQLKLDDELWHVVKNTPRVTGFVGGGQTPAPLSADEVNQILYRQTSSEERPRPKLSFDKNDRVKIIDGPFTNFTGAVEEVNTDRNTLKVMVTIFGRSTPVELEYFQVEKEQV
jgi:transcriptional antiterminator NusG